MARILVPKGIFDLRCIGEEMKKSRLEVEVDADGEVQLPTAKATLRLRLSGADNGRPLLPGDLVYVWWRAGGFVCAFADETEDAEHRMLDMKQQIQLARERIAQARLDRNARRVHIPDIVRRDAQPSMWEPFI